MSLDTILFLLGSLFLVLLIGVFRLWRRSRGEARVLDRLRELGGSGPVPATLHPVIDSTRCIGSGACTAACPQGDNVLGLISGRGTLVDGTRCIGHGRCAAECPVGAIRLVFGSAERGVDIPHLRPTFETNVEGLYITGELGGMGLVANAARQAREGMVDLCRSLRGVRRREDADLVDVAIVGAGPAGLTAALAAQQQGVSYRLLERETSLGGSILHYPRRKLVLTEPVDLPIAGKVFSPAMLKEELVQLWADLVQEHDIRIETGVEVRHIVRCESGVFQLETNTGVVRARRVMLCIGRRGTPRKLGVSGEDSSKVQYVLVDPGLYEGQRVLVVGGGDSALEAACMLAEETSAEVTLSYRRERITRAGPRNRERFRHLVDEGLIRALLASRVLEIRPEMVRLAVDEGEIELGNDAVLVFAGGEVSADLLKRAGVRFERHFGEEVEGQVKATTWDVFETIKKQVRHEGLKDFHARQDKAKTRTAVALAGAGAGLVLGLLWWGGAYYFAPSSVRSASEELRRFAPTGIWGQTMGVIALVLMVSNFLYLIRKESRLFRGAGDIRAWLQVHVFSGLTSAAVVLLHSSLYARNLFAIALYASLGIVVSTGIVGRYIYGFVPLDPRGRPLAHAALVSLSERMAKDFGRLFKRLAVATEVQEVLDLEREAGYSLPALLWRMLAVWPLRRIRLVRLVRRARGEIADPDRHAEFKRYAREMFRIRHQMEYLPSLKRLLGLWRSGHAVLAFFMVFLIAAHIIIGFWVGYRWIF